MRIMTSEKEAKVWVGKLKGQGIKEFQFRHLPEGLREIRMIRKSRSIGLIARKVKTDDYRTIWEIL